MLSVNIFKLSSFQTLNVENLGKASDFQAVPGCGLKCNVSQMEPLLTNLDLEAVNNRKNYMGSLRVHIDKIIVDEVLDSSVAIEGNSI